MYSLYCYNCFFIAIVSRNWKLIFAYRANTNLYLIHCRNTHEVLILVFRSQNWQIRLKNEELKIRKLKRMSIKWNIRLETDLKAKKKKTDVIFNRDKAVMISRKNLIGYFFLWNCTIWLLWWRLLAFRMVKYNDAGKGIFERNSSVLVFHILKAFSIELDFFLWIN